MNVLIRQPGRMALLWLGVLGCLPMRLTACATCFGRSDSLMAQGMNMGILALLVVITSVLAGCVGFFVHLARRAARVAAETETSPDRLPAQPSRS